MKKTLVFLLSALFLLGACNKSSGDGGKTDPVDPVDPDPGRYKDATFKFYLDYSHSDEPILTFKWYVGEPLQVCPEEAKLTNADAADPLYPTFLGYSTHSSSNDETYLWDFAKDCATSQSAVLLYGIWVGD